MSSRKKNLEKKDQKDERAKGQRGKGAKGRKGRKGHKFVSSLFKFQIKLKQTFVPSVPSVPSASFAPFNNSKLYFHALLIQIC
jgi:hypothetical protein